MVMLRRRKLGATLEGERVYRPSSWGVSAILPTAYTHLTHDRIASMWYSSSRTLRSIARIVLLKSYDETAT